MILTLNILCECELYMLLKKLIHTSLKLWNLKSIFSYTLPKKLNIGIEKKLD